MPLVSHNPQHACIATEISIRGAASIEDVINSITDSYDGEFTQTSLSRAANALISSRLLCQKTDIATYARTQFAQLSEDDSSRRTTSTRGRGRGGASRSVTNEGEMEWSDLASQKRKATSLGDQILEMQAKKLKAE